MTDRLNEIKERAEKATPGPWGAARFSIITEPFDDPDEIIGRASSKLADADFIANSRSDIPYLLAEIERLNGKLATAETAIDEAHKALYFWGSPDGALDYLNHYLANGRAVLGHNEEKTSDTAEMVTGGNPQVKLESDANLRIIGGPDA